MRRLDLTVTPGPGPGPEGDTRPLLGGRDGPADSGSDRVGVTGAEALTRVSALSLAAGAAQGAGDPDRAGVRIADSTE